MAKKGKRKGPRPSGHYCRICGEYKANEKFSGKGHAAHICKKCASLPPAERAEAETITKLWNLPGKRLNDGEKKWLTSRIHDQRQEVAEAARQVRSVIFPFAERNERKQRLHIRTLRFELHTEVFDEYGDARIVNQEFTMDKRTNILTMTDFDQGGEVQSVTLGARKYRKLLNWIVHSLEVFAWPEDYQLQHDPNMDMFDPEIFGTDLNILPVFLDDDEDWEEPGKEKTIPEPEGDPYWHVQIKYCNGEEQDISCYLDYLPDRTEELYSELFSHFAPDNFEDEYDGMEDDEMP